MNKANRLLRHPVEFDNAMLFAQTVTVWMDDQATDRGIIEKHTENSVYINGGYYLKLNCTFTI